ncbi:unannotated protein [freshwater metagenome]|uniref:Unannotated protein n=1 Tax=freshwater metagenome TaxID=449393 RepID=A0A6J6AU12_9ZZZZ|nr:hypothetical protein [Actinomycetota bacterium]
MKKNKRTLLLLITAISVIFAPMAIAADMPLLSWERGKQQNIVLGGLSTNAGWKIYLTAPGQIDREFSPSAPNAAGYVVFSIDLPNNLPLGGYSVEARAKGSPDTTVAGVNLIKRNYYTISSIPTDLRLLFTLYAIIISTFAVIRSRKYASLAFTRDKSHKRRKDEESSVSRVLGAIQPFYRFRSRRQDEMEISFLKFVALKDGEPLHKLSPNIWALAPFFTFVLGIYMSYSIQNTTVIPNVALGLIIAIAVIGAVDAISGGTAALGFIFASLILGDITGMRSFLAAAAFVMAWCLPSMLASMYLVILKVDFKVYLSRLSENIKDVLALVLSALLGSVAVVISTILTDSLVINIQGNKFLRWPLMAIVFVLIIAKNLMEIAIDRRRIKREIEVETEVESIILQRSMSQPMTFTLATAIFGITYVWTEKANQSLIATLVISAPFFLNSIHLPRLVGVRFAKARRNLMIEAIIVALLTVAVYIGVQYLPMSTREKAQAFILLGLVPVLLHSVYSSLVATSEKNKFEKEEVEA